jgi:hypothetical protein
MSMRRSVGGTEDEYWAGLMEKNVRAFHKEEDDYVQKMAD